MKTEELLTGVSNCLRLHIHSEPSLDSEIVCKVRYLTEVEIDPDNSTEDFYKIYTAIGAEGFCLKDHITLK
jgi:uncharacterized protein YgiM (DUF1202 family)